MTDKTAVFFEGSDLTLEKTQELVIPALRRADYGEFYQSVSVSESLSRDKNGYTHISVGNRTSGFGLRAGVGTRVASASSSVVDEANLLSAVAEIQPVLGEDKGATFAVRPQQAAMLPQGDIFDGLTLDEKIKALNTLNDEIHALDPNVTNVTLSYGAVMKRVHVLTQAGQNLVEDRPVANLRVSVQVQSADGKTREEAYGIVGGPLTCREVFDKAAGLAAARHAIFTAKELLRAEQAPAGTMDVVMSPGWGGVLLHEAIGHGLEGDFNRMAVSVYSGKVGEKIAADCVTVIDQGDMPGKRGSLGFDDEGTPTQKNVLIENGVLKGYMQDRRNAQLMDVPLTGNGRRQGYNVTPMPRMTNTYFAAGQHTPEEIIASVQDGIYVAEMGGGSVDITSGDFNMVVTLAYRIRDGKLAEPLKGAALIGKGHEVLKNITMVGNDLVVENRSGTCGKNGQSVLAGVGQPTVRVKMVVGGQG